MARWDVHEVQSSLGIEVVCVGFDRVPPARDDDDDDEEHEDADRLDRAVERILEHDRFQSAENRFDCEHHPADRDSESQVDPGRQREHGGNGDELHAGDRAVGEQHTQCGRNSCLLAVDECGEVPERDHVVAGAQPADGFSQEDDDED